METWLQSLKALADPLSSALAAVAALLGGGWFLLRKDYGRRIQTSLDCSLFRLAANPDRVIAEVQFTIENKGLVKHRMYDLAVMIEGLDPASSQSIDRADGEEVQFGQVLVPRTVLLSEVHGDLAVRPNVRKTLSHAFWLRTPGPLIRVNVSFFYDAVRKHEHVVRRKFDARGAMRHAANANSPMIATSDRVDVAIDR